MQAMRLEVRKSEPLTPRIRSLTLAAPDGRLLPGHSAGAHILVSLPDGGERHYSLISTDTSIDTGGGVADYRLGVQLEENGKGGSRFMHGLREGDVVSVLPPRNDFALREHSSPALLIAGGIGVTPIISMATELRRRERPFAFHYSGRSRAAMAFIDEIEALCGEALTIHCDDEPECCLDIAGLIASASRDSHLYVCGPRGMIEAAREQAHARGFAREQVHFELFDKVEDQPGDAAFEVEISSTGQVFSVPPGKSIIEVLEAGGIDLLYDCQRGDCGICQTAVLEGVPDHRDVILTDEERAANDVMQICVSRAKSPRLVLDL
jgi:ferredoxin-NADP reductase